MTARERASAPCLSMQDPRIPGVIHYNVTGEHQQSGETHRLNLNCHAVNNRRTSGGKNPSHVPKT